MQRDFRGTKSCDRPRASNGPMADIYGTTIMASQVSLPFRDLATHTIIDYEIIHSSAVATMGKDSLIARDSTSSVL